MNISAVIPDIFVTFISGSKINRKFQFFAHYEYSQFKPVHQCPRYLCCTHTIWCFEKV